LTQSIRTDAGAAVGVKIVRNPKRTGSQPVVASANSPYTAAHPGLSYPKR